MASSTRIPKAELTGIYGAMVKRMSRKMLGDVPEPVEVAWHNRKVLNFSFSLARRVQKWDQCDENLKSFAHTAVASLVGCSFCLDLGYLGRLGIAAREPSREALNEPMSAGLAVQATVHVDALPIGPWKGLGVLALWALAALLAGGLYFERRDA
jgi:hypothetical protein